MPSCYAIIEYGNELGSTSMDKYFQGQSYYARMCNGNADLVARQHSCFPSFLVEIEGPYMRSVLACCVAACNVWAWGAGAGEVGLGLSMFPVVVYWL